MIAFFRPPAALRPVILKLTEDGFTVEIIAGKLTTNATRADLDAYVQAGTFPAEILKCATLP